MRIAIITAIAEEFRAVYRCLEFVDTLQIDGFKAAGCQVGGHDFVLLLSGMGFDNAARATESIIREARPDLLISTGFCGGIVPELLVGDVVVAKEIIIANESGFEEIPVLLSGIGQTFVARQAVEGGRLVAGTFVSTPVVKSKKRTAAMLQDCYANSVVEMESGAIAIIAAENNIPLLAIRVVSDSAAEELGFSLEEFCDRDMRRIRLHKVLFTLLKKPRIIPQLFRLNRSSQEAADSLAATLTRLFSTL